MHIDNFIDRLRSKLKLELRIIDGSGGGPEPPYKPPVGKSTVGGSPGLLTSTGGLRGTNYQLLMPLFDAVFAKTYLALIDPDDNNTEETCFYTFKQEDVQPNRNVSIHKVILQYRELGIARFSVGVRVYIEDADIFKTESRDVILKPKKGSKVVFPSGLIKTKKVSLVISGMRPQLFISRQPNSGPLCITTAMLCGKADEKDQV